MSFSLSNRALLRGMLAGAVVLTGTACSRADRTESGRDNSSAQPSPSAQSNNPRAETVAPSDKDAAGYRSMERDTTSISETSAAADTTAAGYAEMARDTSPTADQSDTAAAPSGDIALHASIDTNSQANGDLGAEIGVAAADTADSTEILGQVTTDSSPGAGSPDSTEMVQVRPPEDSTENLGYVTTTDEAADETADEQVIRSEDRETVAASETRTDEVGAAAIGGDVTGGEAVALVSRAGVRCAVLDPKADEAVRWDMSNTPVTLNPCGMGSMVLSRIWTEGSGGQE